MKKVFLIIAFIAFAGASYASSNHVVNDESVEEVVQSGNWRYVNNGDYLYIYYSSGCDEWLWVYYRSPGAMAYTILHPKRHLDPCNMGSNIDTLLVEEPPTSGTDLQLESWVNSANLSIDTDLGL